MSNFPEGFIWLGHHTCSIGLEDTQELYLGRVEWAWRDSGSARSGARTSVRCGNYTVADRGLDLAFVFFGGAGPRHMLTSSGMSRARSAGRQTHGGNALIKIRSRM